MLFSRVLLNIVICVSLLAFAVAEVVTSDAEAARSDILAQSIKNCSVAFAAINDCNKSSLCFDCTYSAAYDSFERGANCETQASEICGAIGDCDCEAEAEDDCGDAIKAYHVCTATAAASVLGCEKNFHCSGAAKPGILAVFATVLVGFAFAC